jgi:uncharacterized lipoprotein YddW (UPF0748 family)
MIILTIPLNTHFLNLRNPFGTLFLMLVLMIPSCNQKPENLIMGIKIYGHEGSMDNLFNEWDGLGINTVFSGEDLISNEQFRQGAIEHGITTFVIFPVFFNPEELTASPHVAVINSRGKTAIDEWVEFVCPSRVEYRKFMVEKAQGLVRNYHPDGISIDFIRHFVFWEKVYPDRDPATLPKTCFDSVCLVHFQKETGIKVPESLLGIPQQANWILQNHSEEWTSWRCALITTMVEDIANAVKEIDPEILINVHLVPWAESDFEGAIRSVAGQDIPALQEHTDYLSPMTYAHMVKQQPPWIHSMVRDVYSQGGAKVIPSIQVDKAYLEQELSAEEFEQSLLEALKPPSNGVVFWSWERVATDSEKKEIIRKYCKQ